MSGYKVFQNGDILDANTDVNPFLMKQTVMVFDDAAARTAALDGDESEGMVTYLKDVAHLQRYDGTDWVAAAGLVEIVTFTSNSTFTKATYPWLRAIRVRVQGGGGGGAAANGDNEAGPSGGGGGYAESVITDLSTVSDPITVTVGAGGTGAAAGNNAGSDGGNSSFGTLVVGDGGAGGSAGQGLGGLGGGGDGDLVFRGSGGQGGQIGQGTAGGASHLGGGARSPGRLNSTINGGTGEGFGGGGGGSWRRTTGTPTGGAGAQGIVVVELYA